MVKSWFYGLVSPSMHLYLPCEAFASHQWKSLDQTFSTNSQTWIMDLRLEMQTLKKNDLSVETNTLKLKSFVNNLVTIGKDVTSRDLIIYGLGGLNLDCNSFISSVSTNVIR